MKKMLKKICFLFCTILLFMTAPGCQAEMGEETACSCETYPLERNGIALHLDCVKTANTDPDRNILLIHGSAYSSHEFDIDYQDYSLVRRLAREGYAVWRLDIAGYGQSDPVEDGMLPDTAYAAGDIYAAAEKIVQISGQEKIDLLGWSWGTMTAGRFAAEHSGYIRKLVLYAPILSGLGVQNSASGFSHNTWETAAEDFQRNEDGSFDEQAADSLMIDMFCSSCWRYDGDSSPMGWSRDAFVAESETLIDLEKISAPTLIIYGDRDPYMNSGLLRGALERLPDGSEQRVIKGGSHILMYEKNCYREFQDCIVSFLGK